MCYEILDKEIFSKLDMSIINYYLILRTLNQLDFKSEFKNSQPLFLKSDSIIWDYSNSFFYKDSVSNGIFAQYKIVRTPALLVLENKNKVLLKYNDLFEGFKIKKSANEYLKRFTE